MKGQYPLLPHPFLHHLEELRGEEPVGLKIRGRADPQKDDIIFPPLPFPQEVPPIPRPDPDPFIPQLLEGEGGGELLEELDQRRVKLHIIEFPHGMFQDLPDEPPCATAYHQDSLRGRVKGEGDVGEELGQVRVRVRGREGGLSIGKEGILLSPLHHHQIAVDGVLVADDLLPLPAEGEGALM